MFYDSRRNCLQWRAIRIYIFCAFLRTFAVLRQAEFFRCTLKYFRLFILYDLLKKPIFFTIILIHSLSIKSVDDWPIHDLFKPKKKTQEKLSKLTKTLQKLCLLKKSLTKPKKSSMNIYETSHISIEIKNKVVPRYLF